MVEYVAVAVATPAVVYGFYKLKSLKPGKNDLTPYVLKLNKKKESWNKNKKSTIF